MKFARQPTLIFRIIVLFLVLLIPLYFLAFYENQISRSILKQEIASSMTDRIVFYSNTLDSEISHIVQMKTDLISDEDLQKLSTLSITLSNYERLSAVNRLAKRLLVFKESSRLVSDVVVYIPNIDKTISTLGLTAPMSVMDQRWIREANISYSPRIKLWQDQFIFSVNDSPYSGARTNFYLKIILSREALLQTLQQVALNEAGNFYMADIDKTWLLSSDSQADSLPVELQALMKDGDSGFGSLTLNDEQYFVAFNSSKYLGTRLMVTVPDRTVFGKLDRYHLLLWISSLATLVIIVVFSHQLFLLIHRPLRQLIRTFRRVEHGDFNISISYKKNDEFQYLFSQFNRMVNQLRELIREAYEGKLYAQQAQLKQLQSQINPHFLYNTVFVLHRMASSYGLTDVTKFTDHLGKYLMFLTRTGSDTVALEEEWKHSVIYTEIQKIRFADRIQVEWPELSSEYHELQVPRLILQPILENAYKYGLEQRARDGLLRIRVFHSGGMLTIAIDDNGKALNEDTIAKLQNSLLQRSDTQEMTGLLNVHRRMQLFFGDSYGLKVRRSDLGGLQVEMNLRFRQRGILYASTAHRG